jgi:HSP20 family protein
MALIPWRNKVRQRGPAESSPLATLRTEIDRLFDSFVREPLGGVDWPLASEQGWTPAIDIAEDEKEITVRAEMPGMAPEDLDVSISGSQLVLAGEKRESTEKKGKDFYHAESRYGAFHRSIPLPAAVDAESVEAEYANGVLVIRLKKSPSAPVKRVDVKTND